MSSFRTRQSSGKNDVVDQAAEHLDGRALGADDGVADHAGDDLVVPDPPEVDPLVPFDQRLGELVELLVLATVDVDVGERTARPARGAHGRPAPSGGVTRRISRQPGESKPLPWPSTLRISWYSHGDMCSSMSSCVVAYWRQSPLRRSSRNAAAISLRRAEVLASRPRRRSRRASARALKTGARSGRGARRGAPTRPPSSGARAARRCSDTARSRSHPPRRAPAPRSPRASPRAGAYLRNVRPLLRRRQASAPRRSRRSRSGCGRARSTSSSASSTSSGEGSALRRAIEDDRLSLADPLRAARASEDDARAHRRRRHGRRLRGALGGLGARQRRPRRDASAPATASAANGQRTILFLDEIHRFNKAQQDALLPAVEEGLVTLIGATTENPYFEVNSALLSRCQVIELDALGRGGAARGAAARRRGDRRGGAAEIVAS